MSRGLSNPPRGHRSSCIKKPLVVDLRPSGNCAQDQGGREAKSESQGPLSHSPFLFAPSREPEPCCRSWDGSPGRGQPCDSPSPHTLRGEWLWGLILGHLCWEPASGARVPGRVWDTGNRRTAGELRLQKEPETAPRGATPRPRGRACPRNSPHRVGGPGLPLGPPARSPAGSRLVSTSGGSGGPRRSDPEPRPSGTKATAVSRGPPRGHRGLEGGPG